MPKYVVLFNWTQEGVKGAKQTVDRYRAGKQMVESKGGKIDSFLWTVGPYDLVAVVDAPDDETASAVNLALAADGNVRTLTMRAYTESEMPAIIAKMD